MKYNPDIFFITFTDSINDDKVKSLIAVITDVINQHHPSQIYILFSSTGGGINAGITLYNFLLAVPTKVVFHNIGTVDSIATCIFLAGNKRYACSKVLRGHSPKGPFSIASNFKNASTLFNKMRMILQISLSAVLP